MKILYQSFMDESVLIEKTAKFNLSAMAKRVRGLPSLMSGKRLAEAEKLLAQQDKALARAAEKGDEAAAAWGDNFHEFAEADAARFESAATWRQKAITGNRFLGVERGIAPNYHGNFLGQLGGTSRKDLRSPYRDFDEAMLPISKQPTMESVLNAEEINQVRSLHFWEPEEAAKFLKRPKWGDLYLRDKKKWVKLRKEEERLLKVQEQTAERRKIEKGIHELALAEHKIVKFKTERLREGALKTLAASVAIAGAATSLPYVLKGPEKEKTATKAMNKIRNLSALKELARSLKKAETASGGEGSRLSVEAEAYADGLLKAHELGRGASRGTAVLKKKLESPLVNMAEVKDLHGEILIGKDFGRKIKRRAESSAASISEAATPQHPKAVKAAKLSKAEMENLTRSLLERQKISTSPNIQNMRSARRGRLVQALNRRRDMMAPKGGEVGTRTKALLENPYIKRLLPKAPPPVPPSAPIKFKPREPSFSPAPEGGGQVIDFPKNLSNWKKRGL